MATENEVPSSKERYITEPTAGDELYERGWKQYAQKEFYRAAEDFRRALERSPNHPDILYAYGLALDASGQYREAIEAFERVIRLVENPPDELRDRATIMTRLANGHISRIHTGKWDLKDKDLLDKNQKDSEDKIE